jgi:hypothetical protein
MYMENTGDSNNTDNKNDYNKKLYTDFDTNAVKSITDLWQQYSPMTWSKMYNEFVEYTTRMTEIYEEYAKSSERMKELYKELAANAEKMTELYKESAKSTEKMSKYWLNYFWMKPLSENKEEKNNRKSKNKKRTKKIEINRI